ncbi:MAG: molybdopterin cofactor-binding domain-containing protein [Spirosomataceae bacterium]
MKRRDFLHLSLTSGGALLFGFRTVASSQKMTGGETELNGFILITPANEITIIAPRADIGQGVKTSLPMLIAEELEVEWQQIKVEQAQLNPKKYGAQGGGGSDAIPYSYPIMRKIGAAAREMLVTAAAQTWQVPVSECFAEKALVIHRPTGKKLSYGQLAESAVKLPVPANPTLKDPKDFNIIGTYVPEVDVPKIVTGQPIFGMDVQLPGMLYACIAKPPRFGAKVISVDDAKAKAISGVTQVVKIEPFANLTLQIGGVAVVATSTWAAMKGRDALQIVWDDGPDKNESSAALHQQFTELLSSESLPVIRENGNVQKAFGESAKTIEATYEVPFLAHAPMEVMNYTAHFQGDKLEMWGPAQVPTSVLRTMQRELTIPEENITIHLTRVGGSFGRRLMVDSAVDAALVAKAVAAPVQVVWTREDDFKHDYYRPAGMFRLKGALNKEGKLTAWHEKASTVSRYAYRKDTNPPHSTEVFPDEFPAGMVENFRLEYKNPVSNVPTGPLRAPGHNATAFVIQSFMDELAHAAHSDPLAFRLNLLETHGVMPYNDHGGDYNAQEIKQVLKLATQKAGWGKPLPKGHFHGLAAHVTFGVPVAQVVEISFDKAKKLKIHKVTAAVNCGIIINRNGAEQQITGAIMDGLSAALYGGMPIAHAAAAKHNFHQYRLLRINEAPRVEIHFIESTARPKGLGEMGYPAAIPALCNAIFAATGQRIRKLPIMNSLFS